MGLTTAIAVVAGIAARIALRVLVTVAVTSPVMSFCPWTMTTQSGAGVVRSRVIAAVSLSQEAGKLGTPTDQPCPA